MLNKIILIGRLTKDPETKTVGDGITRTSFILAVDRPRYKSDQEAAADFIPVNTWRKTAEFAEKYFAKGKQVYVSGRLETYTYEADGQKKHGFRVNAEEIGFADSKRDNDDNTLPGGDAFAGMAISSSDDLPF